jgi:hypothetical protein
MEEFCCHNPNEHLFKGVDFQSRIKVLLEDEVFAESEFFPPFDINLVISFFLEFHHVTGILGRLNLLICLDIDGAPSILPIFQ